MKLPPFSEAWPVEVKTLYEHDVQEMWEKSLAPHIWNQYHNQLNYYIKCVGTDAKSILDVGCAQGTLALLLAEQGHNVTAIDIRPDFIEYARARHEYGEINFLVANIFDIDVSSIGHFDLIFANQIVEHLVYPERLLLQLRKLLKPDGRLIVTTPNAEYVRNSHPSFSELGNPKDWEHMQFTADGDGHFFAYLQSELVEIFRKSGFQEIEHCFFETPFISGHMKLRFIHPYCHSKLLGVMDRALIALPWLGRRFAHQLMISGISQVKE